MNPNNKILALIALLCFVLIAIISHAHAYVVPEQVGSAKVKYYSQDINKSKCESIIQEISPDWYEGLRMILIYPENSNKRAIGYYFFPTRVIALYNGCEDIDTLQHELCHHNQYMNGDSWDKIIYHKDSFNDCMSLWNTCPHQMCYLNDKGYTYKCDCMAEWDDIKRTLRYENWKNC